MAGLVTAHVGDATATPFADGTFDVAWTQHVAMNIADKAYPPRAGGGHGGLIGGNGGLTTVTGFSGQQD